MEAYARPYDFPTANENATVRINRMNVRNRRTTPYYHTVAMVPVFSYGKNHTPVTYARCTTITYVSYDGFGTDKIVWINAVCGAYGRDVRTTPAVAYEHSESIVIQAYTDIRFCSML